MAGCSMENSRIKYLKVGMCKKLLRLFILADIDEKLHNIRIAFKNPYCYNQYLFCEY